MIDVERESGLALLFLAETIKAFDCRMAMRAILPFAVGTPFELGGLRRVRQCFARSEQSLDVNTIINRTLTISHGRLLGLKFLKRTLRAYRKRKCLEREMSRGCRSQLTTQCKYGSQTRPSFPPLIICRVKKAGPTPMAASNFCIGFHP